MQIEGIGLGILWYLILLWLLLRSKGGFSGAHITSLFTAKVLGTFALQWVFTYYYSDRTTADIYRFFDDGIILNTVFHDQPLDYLKIIFNTYHEKDLYRSMYFEPMNAWIKPNDSAFYNDNHFLIKINSVLSFVSFGYYEVHGIVFSFLSFLGMKWCAESLVKEESDQNLALTLAVLFPSSLLWMSGGLKETLLIFGIGAFVKVNFAYFNFKFRTFLLAASAMLVLSSVKIYFAAALIPAYIAYAFAQKRKLSVTSQFSIWLLIVIAGFGITYLQGLDIAEYIIRKQHDFLNHVQVIKPGSAFDMNYLHEGLLSILAAIPQALANVLLRPYIYEVSSVQEVLMILENIIIALVLSALVVRSINLKSMSRIQLWILLFILPILILTGMVTPVFGAIMRYRAPAIVLLMIISTPFIQYFINQIAPTKK